MFGRSRLRLRGRSFVKVYLRISARAHSLIVYVSITYRLFYRNDSRARVLCTLPVWELQPRCATDAAEDAEIDVTALALCKSMDQFYENYDR